MLCTMCRLACGQLFFASSGGQCQASVSVAVAAMMAVDSRADSLFRRYSDIGAPLSWARPGPGRIPPGRPAYWEPGHPRGLAQCPGPAPARAAEAAAATRTRSQCASGPLPLQTRRDSDTTPTPSRNRDGARDGGTSAVVMPGPVTVGGGWAASLSGLRVRVRTIQCTAR